MKYVKQLRYILTFGIAQKMGDTIVNLRDCIENSIMHIWLLSERTMTFSETFAISLSPPSLSPLPLFSPPHADARRNARACITSIYLSPTQTTTCSPLSPCFASPSFPSYPFISLIMPTSCPNAIKLLDARRANRETSLTVVVIAGACRVSRCKSSLCLP